MRLNSFDGDYNIDFETLPDIDTLGEWIAKNLPYISFVEIIRNTYDPKVFYKENDSHQSFCQLTIIDLIEDNKYMYEDIQARGLFYINNLDTDFMRKFFNDLAIFLDMNIYIPWDDIETEILDWTFFCSWCINNKGKKIVFDAEEFGDFSKTCYLDSIPHEQLRVYKPL